MDQISGQTKDDEGQEHLENPDDEDPDRCRYDVVGRSALLRLVSHVICVDSRILGPARHTT